MRLKKILTIDDSALVNQVYHLALSRYRRNGAEVLSASNGRVAIEVLGEHPDIDLILLDVNMPEMNGLEFLEYCQNDRVLSHIPKILVSTQNYREETLRGLRLGAKGYLLKPFEPRELHEIIEQVLD